MVSSLEWSQSGCAKRLKDVPVQELEDEHDVVGLVDHAQQLDDARVVERLRTHKWGW